MAGLRVLPREREPGVPGALVLVLDGENAAGLHESDVLVELPLQCLVLVLLRVQVRSRLHLPEWAERD
jgi:hypothetical protein